MFCSLILEACRTHAGQFSFARDFPVPIPGLTNLAWWNGVETRGTVATRSGGPWEIFSLDRDFTKAVLRVEVQ